MPAVLLFDDTAIFTALNNFLVGILPSTTEVVKAQDNRVPAPQSDDYVVMTPLRRERISTNVDTFVDVVLQGSIADDVLSVTALGGRPLGVGQAIFGSSVALGTVVVSLLTGSGSVGTYGVSPSQSVAQGNLYAGVKLALQPIRYTIQLDLYGPASDDGVQIVSTLFRDEYATDFFTASGVDLSPLYCEEPRQMPFSDEADQYENRWMLEICLQANQIVQVPQQFADALAVGLVPVDEFYPA